MRKKMENFWYYHKFKVIVAIFAIVFIILGWNFNDGEVSDLEIGYVIENHNFILEGEKFEEVKAEFESLIHDVDGDGENKEVLFTALIGQRIELEFGIGILIFLLLDKEILLFIDNPFLNHGPLCGKNIISTSAVIRGE